MNDKEATTVKKVVIWKNGEGEECLKFKGKVLWPAVLLLVVGSWVGNVMYFQSMQLAEPLFLKHEISIRSIQGELIELHFLENNNADKKIINVQAEELPQLRFAVDERSRYQYQTLMRAAAEWMPAEAGQQIAAPLTIKEITVFYNKGQPRKVPIGEINVVESSGGGLLDFSSMGSSSTGAGSYFVKLTRSAALEKIEYSDSLKPWFKLNLSGQPVDSYLFPAKFSQGRILSFEYQWSFPDDEPAALVFYKPAITLYFQTEEGGAIVERIPINNNFNLSESQVKRLVRTGGALH